MEFLARVGTVQPQEEFMVVTREVEQRLPFAEVTARPSSSLKVRAQQVSAGSSADCKEAISHREGKPNPP